MHPSWNKTGWTISAQFAVLLQPVWPSGLFQDHTNWWVHSACLDRLDMLQPSTFKQQVIRKRGLNARNAVCRAWNSSKASSAGWKSSRVILGIRTMKGWHMVAPSTDNESREAMNNKEPNLASPVECRCNEHWQHLCLVQREINDSMLFKYCP